MDRLACLLRHWTWADEAMARFDRELADGWDYDDDPMSDRPFGAYYHWCALLCAFGEAALDHGLLSRVAARADPTGHRGQFARPPSVPTAPRRHSGVAGGASSYRGPAPRWRDAASAAARSSKRSVKRSGRSKCRGRSTHWTSRAMCSDGATSNVMPERVKRIQASHTDGMPMTSSRCSEPTSGVA